jgi:hypothetical protein
MERGERWRAGVVSVLMVAAVAWPGVQWLLDDRPSDGFPISTYPMFTRDPGRIVELPTVVAVGPDGSVERLSPQEIAGTDQVIQASVAVRRAIARGPGAARALCREAAGRVSAPATLDVVVERHDAIAWSADSATEPVERRTVVNCEARG